MKSFYLKTGKSDQSALENSLYMVEMEYLDMLIALTIEIVLLWEELAHIVEVCIMKMVTAGFPIMQYVPFQKAKMTLSSCTTS